jgi:hypothetical protein
MFDNIKLVFTIKLFALWQQNVHEIITIIFAFMRAVWFAVFILLLFIILNWLVCGRSVNTVITLRAADRILWFDSRSG